MSVRAERIVAMARGLQIRASSVSAQPSWRGLDVAISGLRIERSMESPSTRPAALASSVENEGESGPGRLDVGSIPIHVRSLNPVVMMSDEGRLTLDELAITVDSTGQLRATFSAEATNDTFSSRTKGPLQARPVRGWTEWTVGGKVQFRDAPGLLVQATLSPTRAWVHFAADGGDSLELVGERTTREERLHVQARGFPLHTLGLTDWLGEHGVGVATASLSGELELVRERGWRLHVEDLRAPGFTLTEPSLARQPVTLGELSIHGDVWFESLQHLEGQLLLSQGAVSAQVEGSMRDDRVHVHAALASLQCQALFDALPSELVGPLEGTQLRGNIEGDLEMSFAMNSSREQQPGSIHVDFPFFERCEVAHDAPAVDVSALAGPYRHTFIDATGREQERVMALGASGFAPIGSIERVAAAFVTLEDGRFWRHDGFDLEQIERAWWHNLSERRLARGASTITQQTARNLYLGLDRSFSRKLQEAMIAARLEAVLTKARILELYLNVIELGPGIHGVEAASQAYFGKPARSLTTLEAIHLASLAPAPRPLFERFRNDDVDAAWLEQLRTQARRMHLHGFIDRDELARAYQERLRLKIRDHS